VSAIDRIAAMPQRWWWLLLIGSGLIARLAWAVALPPREPRFDEIHYVSLAKNLAEDKGYTGKDGRPEAFWPIGYPAILSVCYRIGGYGFLTGFVLQVVLGIATVGLIPVIGGAFFGLRVVRLAALLLAIYPNHVFYSTLNLSEPLFTFLVVASIALLLRGLVRGAAWTAVAGCVLGLAGLVRPLILLFPVVLLTWYWRQRWPFRKALATMALAAGCCLVTVSPWLVRNHGLTASWLTISTEGGFMFWVSNAPGAYGGYAYREKIEGQFSESDRYDYSRGYRLGLEAIAASPAGALVREFQKVSYFFALETDGVLWNFKGLVRLPPRAVTVLTVSVANVAYLFVLGFAVVGLVNAPGTHPLSSLLLLLAGYLVLVTAVFVGDPRYHYALVPVAVIFGAKGFLEDWPALAKAAKADSAGARRKVIVSGVIVAAFLGLMVVNLGLKYLEFKAGLISY
jgi:4-amino-4-deoxy-L-arabinose transferase-like glycosyltransferase